MAADPQDLVHQDAERAAIPDCDWLVMPVRALSDALFTHADARLARYEKSRHHRAEPPSGTAA